MKIYKSLCVVAALAASLGADVLLDGASFDTAKVQAISKGEAVKIDPAALKRAQKSYDELINAAKSGVKIYGLTVGVGLNKDRQMIKPNGELSDELIKASERFNVGLIHAHCGGVRDDLPRETVRAIMAIRANNMLFGHTGVSPKVIKMLSGFINKDIIPAVPSFGSMGEADITILGHLGLAMIGEGEVYYKGEKMSATKALKSAGIEPLVPFGKDSLSILSSNAYSVAIASLAIEELKTLNRNLKLVYALSLEALNGNVSPFSKAAASLRPFAGFVQVSSELREILKDSYLNEPSAERALQDPLSYRDAAYIISTIDESLAKLAELFSVQLNSSDDNPGVANGKVVPSANFEPIIWVLELEKLSIAIAHNSKAASERTIKLSDDKFTHLSRFLGTDETVHAFGAMQKPFVALSGENEALANPVSLNYVPVAGDIEDVATNAPLAAIKLAKAIDNLSYIVAMELIHAAQAIYLRLAAQPDLKLSATTKRLYSEFRKVVKFMQKDRVMTPDFRRAYEFIKSYKG
ncbi:histidine ammonia-lyase [Campylobacter sp. 19-13652]|uniref:HAL/PAL/TAL family ammonia-lyase n=1 Tax=Campylobacter sp. 19-13652 TaxID=2840180 RepID=UPI001C760587|nr:aromatic amino acid ammonia-lyase [Campylobacter sp. 19-13652]BCX78767.1 exported histidine ammonia-lyase [Campylobacter sp. 19-13652]